MSTVSANLIQSLTSGDPTIKHAYGSDDLIADVDEWEKRNRQSFLAGFSWTGAWASGTAYAVNEAVLATTNIPYLCLATHTSATSFAADLATGNWEQAFLRNLTQLASGGSLQDFIDTKSRILKNTNDGSSKFTGVELLSFLEDATASTERTWAILKVVDDGTLINALYVDPDGNLIINGGGGLAATGNPAQVIQIDGATVTPATLNLRRGDAGAVDWKYNVNTATAAAGNNAFEKWSFQNTATHNHFFAGIRVAAEDITDGAEIGSMELQVVDADAGILHPSLRVEGRKSSGALSAVGWRQENRTADYDLTALSQDALRRVAGTMFTSNGSKVNIDINLPSTEVDEGFEIGGIIGSTSIRNASYSWATATTANEYQLQTATGGAGGFQQPVSVYANGVKLTKGTLGSLATTGGWDYSGGEIYVRLADGADPDSKAADFVLACMDVKLNCSASYVIFPDNSTSLSVSATGNLGASKRVKCLNSTLSHWGTV